METAVLPLNYGPVGTIVSQIRETINPPSGGTNCLFLNLFIGRDLTYNWVVFLQFKLAFNFLLILSGKAHVAGRGAFYFDDVLLCHESYTISRSFLGQDNKHHGPAGTSVGSSTEQKPQERVRLVHLPDSLQ